MLQSQSYFANISPSDYKDTKATSTSSILRSEVIEFTVAASDGHLWVSRCANAAVEPCDKGSLHMSGH